MHAEHAAAISEERILAELTEIVVDIVGAEYAVGLDVGMETSVNGELELESIEFVMLAAKLRERYGERVDLAAFIAGKDVHELIELTVGDVVAHVAACIADG